MDRFERLLDTDATETERALLDTARDDVPSSLARSRTLTAMGVGAGVLTGAAHAAHAAHAATNLVAAGAASATKVAGTISAVMLLKWLGTGAIVGCVVAAAVATGTTPGLIFSKHAVSAASEPAAIVQATPARPAARLGGASSQEPAVAADQVRDETSKHVLAASPERGERLAAVAETNGAPVALVVSPPAPAAQQPAASSVVAEVASLDRARAALAMGDAREALARLSAHDAAFAGGTLQPEAVVLRVRALIAIGERGRAAEVANRFIAAHPESAQAGRLRALIGAR